MINSSIPIPENEAERLTALLKYNILDTAPEEQYDRITKLAAIICDAPIAMINLIDSNRKWSKSRNDLKVSESPRDTSFCQYTIMDDVLFEIPDTLNDERFKNNPSVIGKPYLRFYAGMPLKNPEGYNLGALCVVDKKPKKLSTEQKKALAILSQQVVELMEIRKRASFMQVEFGKSVQDKIDALENNLLFYKEALDETAIVAITDQNGIINYANKKFCELSKYSKEELLGQDHRIINSGYHSKEFIKSLWTTIANGKIFRAEIRNKAKDGSFYWVDSTIVPFLNEEGKPYKYVAIRQDITEKKKTEIELIEAKEKAEQSVIAKNDFLSNMSHEIRTPMNAIVGFTDLLEQTKLDENQREYVNSVKLAGTGLLSIINDILDFSKIESGRIAIESVPFSLKECLKNIYNLLSVKAKEKKLEYNFLLDASLPDYVIGDTTRLNQILINLIGNAIKFTEKGSITVSAKIIEEEDAYYKMKFIIQDTGIGIPADKLELIFDRFSQANNDTTRKYGGTGLGLSIAKNLVELLGGELKVISEVGKGSEFSFDIKYKKTEAPVIETRVEETLNKSYGHVKILLCEDNTLNQRLAIKVLSKMGFDAEIANNGQIGIEKLKNEEYDLVLMDIQMPVMDGYEATRIIRNELNLKTPIIAMTAQSLVGEKEKCIEIGMNDYIGKPFKQNDLFQKIVRFLSEKKADSNIESKLTTKNDSEPHSELINLNYLKELSGGDKPFEREMIELFLNKVPQEIKLLENAFFESDTTLIKSLSHKLKSSMAIVGLSNLSTYLSDIENDTLNKESSLEKFTFVKNILNEQYSLLQKKIIEEY